MVSMFNKVEEENRRRFISLYRKYLDNPNSETVKKEANGMGILGDSNLFSEDINEAADGSVRMVLGELTLSEAKKILKKLMMGFKQGVKGGCKNEKTRKY